MNAHNPAPPAQGPANLEAEQALLGAILINNAAYREVESLVSADDFSEELHQRIYAACVSLISEGRVATPITIKGFFAEQDIGGMTVIQYVSRLASSATTILNAPDYARAVRFEALRRAAIEIAVNLKDTLLYLRPDASVAEVIGEAVGEMQKIAEGGSGGKIAIYEAGEASADLIEQAERTARGENKRQTVRSGFPAYDKATGGYQPGSLVIIGARPGIGKTALACSSARMAAQNGAGVAIFSGEVPQRQITARIVSDLTFHNGRCVPYGALLQGLPAVLEQSNAFKLRAAQKALSALPLVYFDPPSITVPELGLQIRAIKRRFAKRGVKLGVVFLDYLKQIRASARYQGQRHYEVGEISGQLKALSKQEDLCIVLLAQLNRNLEGRDRKDRRPQLADLRESGDLEADADVVAFLHREAFFIKNSPEFISGKQEALDAFAEVEHSGELILGKNRAGPTRTIEIKAHMASSSLYEGDLPGFDQYGHPHWSQTNFDDYERIEG